MAEINQTIIEETAEYRVIQETYDARPGDIGLRKEWKAGRDFNKEQLLQSAKDSRTRLSDIRTKTGTIRTRAQAIRSGYAAMTNAQKNQAVSDLADHINDLAGAQNDLAKMVINIHRIFLDDIDTPPEV